ncbi:MAG: DUF4384 domain-containing protein [Idiomarina sp.]|nr:DUF4384 domain-containing protein [Idiomarina sp.]
MFICRVPSTVQGSRSSERKAANRIIASFILLFSATHAVAEERPFPSGMGAVLDDQVYAEQPAGPPLTRGNYANLPSRVSLEGATPTPGDQGRQGSCVGWAVAYAARTIAEANTRSLSRQAVDNYVFSPSFVYNQILSDDCDSGSQIHTALNLIQRQGVPLMRDFPYDASTCSQPILASHRRLASEYRISSWRALSRPGARSIHVPVRRALAAEHPVIIGMLVSNSFSNTRAIRENNGVWIPTSEDYDTRSNNPNSLYGHAMTVVGYDDNRFGGAFRIINSWGTSWGDNGYVWVRYEDFSRFVIQAFEVIPEKPTPPAEPNLGGAMRFFHINDDEMQAAQRSGGIWRLNQPYPSGTRFRVELTSDFEGYVYVIGGDLEGNYVELFPRRQQVSSRLVRNETMVIPGPTEDFYTRMDDNTGTDFYVVLFSRSQIDVRALLQRVNQADGSPRQRLQAGLGRRMEGAEEIEYLSQRIGARAHVPEDGVLPLIVEIEHVEPSEDQQDTRAPRIVLNEPSFDPHEELSSGQRVYRVSERSFTIRGIAQDESRIRQVQVEGSIASRFSSLGPFEAQVVIPEDATEAEFVVRAVDAAGNEVRERITVILDEGQALSVR